MEQFSYFPKLSEFLELRRDEYRPASTQAALPEQSGQTMFEEPPLVPTERRPEELLEPMEYRLLKNHFETWQKNGPEKVDKKFTKSECDQVAGILDRLWQFGFLPARVDNQGDLRFCSALGGVRIRPECRGATWEDIKTRFLSKKLNKEA